MANPGVTHPQPGERAVQRYDRNARPIPAWSPGELTKAYSLVGAAPGRSSGGHQNARQNWIDSSPKTIIDKTPQELKDALPELAGLEAATDQNDLSLILKKVGENVESYFHNFVSTSALEETVQQILKPNGKVQESFKQKFRYLLIFHPDQGEKGVEEYRTDKKGRRKQQQVLKGGTLTTGFASMPNHFHPDFQDDSNFRLLGRQKLEGHDTYVVAFAQRPELARYREQIYDGASSYVVFLEGLAWIDSNSYQIIRMSTELLPDLSPKSLQEQKTEITFAEVHFTGIPMVFWLPREVVVETEWMGSKTRNFHHYSDFKLFASETKLIY